MRLAPLVPALALLSASQALAQPDVWPVAEQYESNLRQPNARALERGAEVLAAHQGGWSDPAGGAVRHGWEWQLGSHAGAENCSGLVALALLEAGADRAARARADEVIRQAEAGERLYAPDVELLARMGRFALARAQVRARLEAAGGAEGEVRRLALVRGAAAELVGYDAAQLAEAALAAGEVEDAQGLVRAAIARESEWKRDRAGAFALVSDGALLAAAARLGLRQEAARLTVALLAAQDEDGSWLQHATQATAYATRGLALAGKAFGDRAALRAAERGGKWLRLTQLRSGAWADYNDLLPEPWVGDVLAPESAEALRALVALR